MLRQYNCYTFSTYSYPIAYEYKTTISILEIVFETFYIVENIWLLKMVL